MPDSNKMFGKSSEDTPEFFFFVVVVKKYRWKIDDYGLNYHRHMVQP